MGAREGAIGNVVVTFVAVLQATRALTAVPHAPAVVVVTTFDDDAYVLDAIAAGARGFLLKRCSGRELVAAVRRLEERGADRPTALSGMLRLYAEGMHSNEPVHTWPLP